MNITNLDVDLSLLGNSNSVRAEGLHASDIYNDLYKHLEPKRFDRPGAPPPLLLETGLILETALEEGLARKFEQHGGEDIKRPGEFTYTGVFDGYTVKFAYNPDLFIFNGCFRIGEIKATWMSSKIPHDWLLPENRASHAQDIADAFLNPKFDKYYTQIKLYAKALQTTYARLYVCFIAGDYSRPYKSQLVGVDLEFTEDELDQEWSMCCYHAISKGMIK